MKTKRITLLISAAVGVATLSTCGCAKKEPIVQAPAPAARDMNVLASPALELFAFPVAVASGADATISPARWADIKDHAFAARAAFLIGLKALEATADGQIAELKSKRATMQGNPSAKDWDFAMKEMIDARSYLKSMGAELGKATAETWDQQKEKVGQAWVRTQEAYAKVRSSTTG